MLFLQFTRRENIAQKIPLVRCHTVPSIFNKRIILGHRVYKIFSIMFSFTKYPLSSLNTTHSKLFMTLTPIDTNYRKNILDALTTNFRIRKQSMICDIDIEKCA